MKLQYIEKNVKLSSLLTIRMTVTGLLDAHIFGDSATYSELKVQFSDSADLTKKHFTHWMDSHDFINISHDSDVKKRQFIRDLITALDDAIMRMSNGEMKHDHLVSMKTLDLPEGKYELEWKLSKPQEHDVAISHHRPLEDFAPSFPQDIDELMAFDQRAVDWSSDQGKHNLKSLAYWSRLRHYLPSSDMTQSDLITFYSIWLKLSHEERDTYRSFIESL